MVHPKVNNYHVLEVVMSEGQEEKSEIFVGRIDGVYHLLGDRPVALKYMFSENECASLDLGIVKLPKGKQSLSELVKGDIISVENQNEQPGPFNGAVYLRSR